MPALLAARRVVTLSGGGGVPPNAIMLNGRPVVLNGRYIVKGA